MYLGLYSPSVGHFTWNQVGAWSRDGLPNISPTASNMPEGRHKVCTLLLQIVAEKAENRTSSPVLARRRLWSRMTSMKLDALDGQ